MISFACKKNKSSILKAIWESGKTCILNDDHRNTLFRYIKGGYLIGVDYYLEQLKVDPNITDSKGNTLLMHGIRYGRLDIVKLLIEKYKLDLNILNQNGQDALNISLLGKKYNIIKYLMDKNLVSLEKAQQLAKQGLEAMTNDTNDSKNLQILNLFITYSKIDLQKEDFYGETILTKNIIEGKSKIVRNLIEFLNVDPKRKNSKGKPPILYAVEKENLEIIKFLVEKCGVDPDQSNIHGETALFISSQFGFLPIIKYLIETKKVDPNQSNKFGRTPLMESACNSVKKIEIIYYLISEAKANPYQEDSCGGTILFQSIQNDCYKDFYLLVEGMKVDPKVANSQGKTSLMIAFEYRRFKLFKLLLRQYNVDPDYQDKTGQSVLCQIVSNNELKFLESFLEIQKETPRIQSKKIKEMIQSNWIQNEDSEGENTKKVQQEFGILNEVGIDALNQCFINSYVSIIQYLVEEINLDINVLSQRIEIKDQLNEGPDEKQFELFAYLSKLVKLKEFEMAYLNNFFCLYQKVDNAVLIRVLVESQNNFDIHKNDYFTESISEYYYTEVNKFPKIIDYIQSI